MVSVRKSHQMSVENFDTWLAELNLSAHKKQGIETLWNALKATFSSHLQCQQKSLEMVEILAGLNMDRESLCAALLVPLIEQQIISLDNMTTVFKISFSLHSSRLIYKKGDHDGDLT